MNLINFELKAYNFYGTLLFVDPNDPMTRQALSAGLIAPATEEFVESYVVRQQTILKENNEFFNKIRFQNAELN